MICEDRYFFNLMIMKNMNIISISRFLRELFFCTGANGHTFITIEVVV
jgi:hypothetical protein